MFEAGDPGSGRRDGVPDRRRFGPERVALAPVVVWLLGSLPLVAVHPALSTLVLLPLVAATWTLRARVVAAPVGVEVCNGLRATRLAWSDVEGFTVPGRGPIRLLRRGARPLLMTALHRRDLPVLMSIADRAGRAPAA